MTRQQLSQRLLVSLSLVCCYIALACSADKNAAKPKQAGNVSDAVITQEETPGKSSPELSKEEEEASLVSELVLYRDGVEPGYSLQKWDNNSGAVSLSEVPAPGRGQVWNIVKQGSGSGNAFIVASNGPIAPSAQTYLVFDINIVSMDAVPVFVKIASAYPQVSDLAIQPSVRGHWQTVVIPLAQLKERENSLVKGQKVQFNAVEQPFVIEPSGVGPWHMQLDNIRLTSDIGNVAKDGRAYVLLNAVAEGSIGLWDNNTNTLQVTTKAQADGGRTVIDLTKNGPGPANAFLKVTGQALDLSSYASGFIEAEVNVKALNGDKIRIKIDSGWPNTSDVTITQAAGAAWQKLTLPLAGFAQGNSVQAGRYDITAVTNLFVIEPVNEGPWQLQIGAVTFVAPIAMAKNAALARGHDWELVWIDEFSGNEIDKTKWSHEVNCWGGGNGERQCYTDSPANSFVKDGILHLVAMKGLTKGRDGPAGDGAEKTGEYSSARLRTFQKGDFKYGRICASLKLPAGKAVWPAFWMLPTKRVYGEWPQSGEIDIMEVKDVAADLDTTLLGTLHFGGPADKWVHKPQLTTIPKQLRPDANFHEYCVIWEHDAMHWEFNGTRYGTLTEWWSQKPSGERSEKPVPFDQEFHLLLNVAVGGNFGGVPNEDTLRTPQAMEVDWVKVERCKLDPAKPTRCYE